MSQSGDERDVRVFRVHDQTADRARVAKPGKLPGLAGVDGFVYSVSADDVAADARFPGANINNVGIGFGNRERADGRRSVLLFVKERLPVEAAIGGLPDAACNAAKIISVVLADDAGNGENASTAKWPDEAIGEPLPRALVLFIVLLGDRGRNRRGL